MKNKKVNQIPRFKDEDEERDFWANHDATDYFDTFTPVELDLSKLKFSTETISLRVPIHLLDSIKELANAKDVPYQSLMKIFLSDRVEKELKAKYS